MPNTMNDYEKHLETTRRYLQQLAGHTSLEDLSAEELIPMLAQHMHGLNGGPTLSMDDAAEVVGFDPSTHVLRTGEDTWQVLVMIEFDDSEEAMLKSIEDAGYEMLGPVDETIH